MRDILIRHAHIADCPALARIIITATESAFRGRVPDKCLTWLTPEESAANWAKNFKTEDTLDPGDYLYVATNDTSGVVGFAMLTPVTAEDEYDPHIADAYFNELRSIHIDPAWQRQGIGRRLVAKVADTVQRDGGNRLLVKVLVENPNVAFYERLGAVLLGSRPYDWEEHRTTELIYGWRDVTSLS